MLVEAGLSLLLFCLRAAPTLIRACNPRGIVNQDSRLASARLRIGADPPSAPAPEQGCGSIGALADAGRRQLDRTLFWWDFAAHVAVFGAASPGIPMVQPLHYRSQFGHRFYNMLDAGFGSMPWAYKVRIVRGVKTLKSPLEYVQRRTLARRVATSSPFAHKVTEDNGYWLFGPQEVPGAKEAAALTVRAYQDLKQSGALEDQKGNKKKHLRAILRGDDFAKYPEIGRFVVSRPVLEVAAGYFGSAPILSSICLFWSVINDSVVSSQKWHVDGEDTRQLKLFVNSWDLADEHGPLTFFPASTTDAILNTAKRETRLNAGDMNFDDDFIDGGSHGKSPIKVVGEAGAGVFIDTSRCVHFGSRRNTKERLMLMVQYAPYNLARESSVLLGSTEWIPHDRNDPLQRMALRQG
jgi:hypothetical protein